MNRGNVGSDVVLGEALPPKGRGHGGTSHVKGRRLVTLAVAVSALVLPNGTAAAAETTAPYASSGTRQWCDVAANCTTSLSANRDTGALSLDLRQQGGVTYEPAYCGGGLGPCGYVRDAEAEAMAWVVATQAIAKPVSSVRFTVTAHTGEASVSTSGASTFAIAEIQADATGTCNTCRGYTSETIVSSATPSATARTRTLELIYRDNLGGKIPAGTVNVWVVVRGVTSAGLGSMASVHAVAVVGSVSSTVVP